MYSRLKGAYIMEDTIKRWIVSCPEVQGVRYMSLDEFNHFVKYSMISSHQIKGNQITMYTEFQYCDFCSGLDWYRENWK